MEVEETPGHRVARCKPTACKARLSKRNKEDAREIKGNHRAARLIVCVCIHRSFLLGLLMEKTCSKQAQTLINLFYQRDQFEALNLTT